MRKENNDSENNQRLRQEGDNSERLGGESQVVGIKDVDHKGF